MGMRMPLRAASRDELWNYARIQRVKDAQELPIPAMPEV